MVYQSLIMSKNFMIGFMYQDYFYCANVHRSHASPAEYQVVVLSNNLDNEVPARMVLKEIGDKLLQTSGNPAPPVLLTNILAEIEKHTTLS